MLACILVVGQMEKCHLMLYAALLRLVQTYLHRLISHITPGGLEYPFPGLALYEQLSDIALKGTLCV